MDNETQTLQLWPGGKGVTFRGEYPHYQIAGLRDEDDSARVWREASEAEAKEIRIEQLARMYSDRDILAMDSSLVDDLIKHCHDLPRELMSEWDLDSISNLLPDPSNWDIEECREWLEDRGYGHELEDVDEDDWRQAVQDNAEPAEIYEWWRVTKWLADNLQEIGECVLSNAYGDWWGRCCTGQGYLMDGTLQAVARRFV